MKRVTRIKIILLVIIAVAAAVILPYLDLPKEEALRISLIYDNASKGINPDGSRFSPYDIVSDEILAPVAEEFGMTSNQIREHVWVSYEGSEDQITTDFLLKCKGYQKDFADTLLLRIGKEYEDYMEREYLWKNTVAELYDDGGSDMLDTLENLAYESSALAKQVNGIYENTGRYAELRQQLEDAEQLQINTLRDIVVEKGEARDPRIIKRILEFRNLLLEKQAAIKNEQRQVRLDAIEIYDATLFPTISVPSVSRGEYYISTTHTGLDDIYTEAKIFMDEYLALKNTVTINKYALKRLKGVWNPLDGGVSGYVEGMVEDASQQVDTIAEQVRAAIDETNAELVPFITYELVGKK